MESVGFLEYTQRLALECDCTDQTLRTMRMMAPGCERIIANGETDVDLLIRYFKEQDSFEAYREIQNRIIVK